MKETTATLIRQVQKLTELKCQTCPTREPYRCCDRTFCDLAEQGAKALGYTPQKTDHPDLPYMGPKGCVIPAEYRPGCSTYVCFHHLEDREFRREYNRKMQKIQADTDFRKALECTREMATNILLEKLNLKGATHGRVRPPIGEEEKEAAKASDSAPSASTTSEEGP